MCLSGDSLSCCGEPSTCPSLLLWAAQFSGELAVLFVPTCVYVYAVQVPGGYSKETGC